MKMKVVNIILNITFVPLPHSIPAIDIDWALKLLIMHNTRIY
jgi:hypothetical protein